MSDNQQPQAETCPHCGAADNTGVAYECGTQYVAGETFGRTHECRRRSNAQDRATDDAINEAREARHFGED